MAEVYKAPAKALAIAWIIVSLTTIYIFVIRHIFGVNFAGGVAIVAMVLLTAEAISLLRAGYVFNKVSRY